jgi:hypothetical protein
VLIESLIKPEARFTSRSVDIFGVRYEFEAVKKDRYVAVVEDQAAIDCLLANKAYREFTDKLGDDTTPKLSKTSTLDAGTGKVDPPAPPAPPKPAATVKPEATKPEQDGTMIDTDVNMQAQALLSSTPLAIKKQLEKHLPSREVLAAAIVIEKAADKPRQLVLSGLTGALKSMDA